MKHDVLSSVALLSCCALLCRPSLASRLSTPPAPSPGAWSPPRRRCVLHSAPAHHLKPKPRILKARLEGAGPQVCRVDGGGARAPACCPSTPRLQVRRVRPGRKWPRVPSGDQWPRVPTIPFRARGPRAESQCLPERCWRRRLRPALAISLSASRPQAESRCGPRRCWPRSLMGPWQMVAPVASMARGGVAVAADPGGRPARVAGRVRALGAERGPT